MYVKVKESLEVEQEEIPNQGEKWEVQWPKSTSCWMGLEKQATCSIKF